MLANETRMFIETEGVSMAVSQKEIKSALASYLRAILDLNEHERIKGEKPYEGYGNTFSFKDGFKRKKIPAEAVLRLNAIALQDKLSGKDDTGAIESDNGDAHSFGVDTFIKCSGLPEISQDDPLYEYTRRELLKLEQAINHIETERNKGLYNTPIEHSILTAYPETQAPYVAKKERQKPLSEFVQQYIDENVNDGNWAGGSVATFSDHLTVLVEILGDYQLSQINYEKIRGFYDNLRNFPANRSKLKAYRDKSIPELLEMKIPKKDCLKTNTILNYFRTFNGFFNWAVGRDYMEKNYAALIKIRRDKAPHEEKDIFLDQELKMLFDDIAHYKESPEQSHRFWIPLIGLYSGARLEEISQFSIDDLKLKDGVWIFDISGKVKGRAIDDKKIKTNVSKRLVPVHASLIDAGLLSYQKKIKDTGEKRLFPDVTPFRKKKDGEVVEIKYGFYLGKWFGQHLKKLNIKTDDHNVSFHSLRHSFDTKAKYLDLPRNEINQIVGHAGGTGEEGRYAKPFMVNRLKKTIDQIIFPL